MSGNPAKSLKMNQADDAARFSIRCNDLSVQFANNFVAVDHVQLDIEAGHISVLIGPSGCGKTTILRLIAGLQTPSTGNVDLRPNSTAGDGQIAFVFQQPSLLPWRTAMENVILPLELLGRGDAKDRHNQAMQTLASVDLADSHDRLPHQLSGGMKMRVSLARALVTEPSVLLLDEPFAALDDMLRSQLGELLLRLWQERLFTTVMVTHNIAEACVMAHQIHVMREGQIEQSIENPLPWPRSETLRRRPEFGDFYGRVGDALRDDA
ncbi:Sulfate/thiosulfate import ATP-binding protein CysA [Planctomycetes bacterium CA13]|uniref:Sulfate/thiosulfate import ATP-binding protein CysA n=1 Tax=Novipirellula herctigrandis TaxID=2527986 RepID=A0A5C5Z9J0_9BACT|nr:Sulfate/thiosulfate import ATP-binding protein CysA [Planctomycetes bacterium CA13]